MNHLILSDTHLSDKFDEKKFNYLKKLIEATDRVILNGDFWDGYLTSFEDFVKSEWRELFPLLRAKKAVYLFGNHDLPSFSDARVKLFSAMQGMVHHLKVDGKRLKIEHGHRFFFNGYPRLFALARMREKMIEYMMSAFGKDYINFAAWNEKMKSWVAKGLGQREILVCGHTHFPEFNLKEKFINLGFIDKGYSSYLKIQGKEMKLVEERY
ncbi:MAG: Uncharacterized protein G01um101418_2 [Parcubacteria group bacterium Gr01-1014_18]|nr:MAG: Uncharacterized protein Greene041636_2 [Parcubacteria group bacterium Greene0416_36]TSC81508.1 MAG: Uncharacterized protein G01um101418_2 [Parcubacteria group bacterium Gr01-1014_18]TSC99681.1 MAG: Uncharacterized protein Greene101420_85 [Parcubacteria group bacterium Greene1014_20]TSD07132.1 MAG: Uncharacterized protein Greene07142_444 [Parcubacteria group bacterium Greene0714_2]